MIATGETMGLGEWIIDDTCLVVVIFLLTKIFPLLNFTACEFLPYHVTVVPVKGIYK